MGEQGSSPCGRPYRKLKPTYIILSSSHAKNLAVYYMSTACGRPQVGKGVRLRWTQADGEQGSSPCERPYRKLKPTDVILYSSHAKNLAVYFMSTACGRPQGGGGQWTITSLPNLLLLFHMYCSKRCQTT